MKDLKVAYHIKLQVIIWGKLFVQIFKMNMLEKINKSGVIKIIGKKLIVWDFSTNLPKILIFFFFYFEINLLQKKKKMLGLKKISVIIESLRMN